MGGYKLEMEPEYDERKNELLDVGLLNDNVKTKSRKRKKQKESFNDETPSLIFNTDGKLHDTLLSKVEQLEKDDLPKLKKQRLCGSNTKISADTVKTVSKQRKRKGHHKKQECEDSIATDEKYKNDKTYFLCEESTLKEKKRCLKKEDCKESIAKNKKCKKDETEFLSENSVSKEKKHNKSDKAEDTPAKEKSLPKEKNIKRIKLVKSEELILNEDKDENIKETHDDMFYKKGNKNNYDVENMHPHKKKWFNKEKRTEYNIIIPIKARGRQFTVSIALPSSILEETCQRHELRTFIIGQIARAACIYSVDEIIVYNDNCWANDDKENFEFLTGMMKMILQYQECPQYLRKHFFGFHPYASRVGILNALNAPHHLRYSEWCDYREGITTNECENNKTTMVDVGLPNLVKVDSKIVEGVRVTVKFSEDVKEMKSVYGGTVVSPTEPRTKGGLYWGYTVRMAGSLSEALKPEDEQDAYDLLIGTSERGSLVENTEFKPFKRALIVFGGVQGLEEAISKDDNTKELEPLQLFHHYVNTCPNQTSRTIRTEEAILISLSALQSKLFTENESKI